MDIGQVRGNLFTIKRDFWNTCGLLTRVCKRDLTSLLGQQQYSLSTTTGQVQSNKRPSTKYQETRLHGSIVGRCRGEYASTWPALSPSQRYLWPQWPPLGREPPPLHRCIISQCTIQTSVVLRLRVSCVVFFACFAVLFCPYVSLVRRSAPLVLVCSAFMSTVVFCVMRCCVVYYVLLVFCVVVFCLYVPLVSPAALVCRPGDTSRVIQPPLTL